MKPHRKTIWRLLGLAALLVLAAGLIAPRLDADRFGQRVKRSLEEALGRGVEIQGRVHLDLFNGPGFSVDRVIIHDDPRAGIEPFAYVESLEARVSFKSFWTGRLEFSSLRLVNPSVNLVRPDRGAWNFEHLLMRTAGAAPLGVRLPEIRLRGGRINFKFGDTKSIFYFNEAELDASPPSSPAGEWRLRFEGTPARTDRPAYAFGSFAARGRWRPDAATGGQVDLTLDIERAALPELIRLVHGYDIGVHGQISSQARLAGPVSDVRIAGRMQVGDIHRWDLLPSHGEGWRLDYRGRWDMVSQTLELETVAPPGGTLPLSVRVRASGYPSQPRWAAIITWNRLPLAPLAAVARHMGLALPASLVLDGELSGVLGYSPGQGFQGKLLARQSSVTLPDSPPLRLAQAELVVDGTRVRLGPAAVEVNEDEEAALAAEYSWQAQSIDAVFSTDSMSVPAPENGWARVLGTVPIIQNCRRGYWRGHLRYSQQGDQRGEWTGALVLEQAQVALPGLAEPVELSSARVTLRDDVAVVDRMTGRAGAVEFTGDYRYRPSASRPHQYHLAFLKLDAADLERLLLPAFERRESFLTRALRLGRSSIPEWIEQRHADGAVEIGSFTVADLRLEKLRARVRWDGAAIDVTEIAAEFGDGQVSGRLSANLRRAVPAYRVSGRFHSINWMGGRWEGRGLVQTSGVGQDLLRNLHLEASFNGQSVSPAADTEFKTVSGSCIFTLPRGLPRFRFSDLQATVGEDLYQGQGATGADGRLHFELSDGQKQMRLSGTVTPFQLDLVAGRNPGQ